MSCNCQGRNTNTSESKAVRKSFKEEAICEILYIPEKMPNIENILEVMVDPVITNLQLIPTEEGTSNEGQRLTGYKLLIDINLREKVLYVADEITQSVQGAHFEVAKTFFIIPPKTINGRDIEELFEQGRLQVKPCIEKIYARALNCRTIHKCMLIFLELVAI